MTPIPAPAQRDPDPYVLYTVMRRGLQLTTGKAVSQGQHAMDYAAREAVRIERLREAAAESEEERARLEVFEAWRDSPDHAKVVLGASDKEFEQVKVENPRYFLVIDLGYTQVAPNTETCLGLWPMRKSARSPILKKLLPL